MHLNTDVLSPACERNKARNGVTKRMISAAGRILRTVRYLMPGQIGWLVYRRLQPVTPVRVRGDVIPVRRQGVGLAPRPCNCRLGWDGSWTFEFVGEARSFTPASMDWHPPDVSRLWRYNLHYFDYLLDDDCLVASRDQLLDHWIAANPPGTADAWEAYPTALRIVNWIDYLLRTDATRAPKDVWLKSLLHQAAWLARNVEYHIRGNHLFKNGVALLFAGVFFQGSEAERWLALGQRILEAEIAEQFLPDGGHYERSPMYHSIVTQDVLDVVNLLRSSPAAPQDLRALFEAKASAAMDFLGDMLHPDGEIALFNDSAFGIALPPAELRTYAERVLGSAVAWQREPKDTVIINRPETGYYGCRAGGDYLIVDCGPIGPDYQPGHAHCDTLSFELSIDGERVIVDSGVSGYEGDPLRGFVRSTAAHNTVCVDGAEQSEMWGTFRVGRRARPLFARIERVSDDEVVFEGAHDGYAHLPQRVIHHRRIVYRPGDRVWQIVDRLEGEGEATIEAFLHLAPGCEVKFGCGGLNLVAVGGEAVAGIRTEGWTSVGVEHVDFCPHFGARQRSPVLRLALKARLPILATTFLDRNRL